jgi:putative peptide zinc metalloprotease protein
VVDPAGRAIAQEDRGMACTVDDVPTRLFPVVAATDDTDDPWELTVRVHWSGFHTGAAPMVWDGDFYGTVGPIPYLGKPNAGGEIEIRVTATDLAGATSQLGARGPVKVQPCAGVPF